MVRELSAVSFQLRKREKAFPFEEPRCDPCGEEETLSSQG
jgi:hypothetical protein